MSETMVWFEGSVDEAVRICKQRAGLLTIFVQDSNEQCQVLEGIFTEPDVASIITAKQDEMLLLKITQGTTNFDLLNSVYPVASIPMIQFIDGSNGLLLFSVKPSNKEDIAKGLKDGIDTWLHQRAVPTPTRRTATDKNVQRQSSPPPVASMENQSSTSAAESEDIEAKVARAQERANQIRQRKEREAELAKREKEIQRRKDGQLTAEAERQRTLNQAEQIRLDLEKERKEEAAHRQRVLDNLRRDKEDRERRQREAREGPSSDSQTTVTSSFTTSVTNLVDYARSKIQFRYDGPEGMRSFIGDFAAEDPFITAIDYVKKETGLRGSLTLRQLYPRRDFSESDGKSTMKDLGLVPNGVLLVLPSVAGGSSNRSPSSGSVLGFLNRVVATVTFVLLLPFQGINSLIGYVFPRPRIDNANPRPTTYSAADRSSSDRPAGSNVHRRRPAEDATYNGNSTQQL